MLLNFVDFKSNQTKKEGHTFTFNCLCISPLVSQLINQE